MGEIDKSFEDYLIWKYGRSQAEKIKKDAHESFAHQQVLSKIREDFDFCFEEGAEFVRKQYAKNKDKKCTK